MSSWSPGLRWCSSAPAEGLLREALLSLREVFGVTREILRRYGPAVAPKTAEQELSFGYLAVGVLNGALRPLLAIWHPTLAAYEATRPEGRSPVEWERHWSRAEELRAELAATRGLLVEFARTLGEVAGAASLLPVGHPGQAGEQNDGIPALPK